MKSFMAAKKEEQKEKQAKDEETVDIKNNIVQWMDIYKNNLDYFEDQEEEIAIVKESCRVKLLGLKVVDPKFEFETTKDWEKLAKREIELDTKRKVRKLKTDSIQRKSQQERITENYVKAIERLKELGADVSEYENKTPTTYIG